MPKCDICGRERDVRECKVRDDMGTRYRNLCEECILSAGASTHIDIVNNKEAGNKKIEQIENIENIIMTTSHSFEGYRITEYKGIIFDETISGIGLKTAFKGIGDMFASLTGDQMYAVTNRINDLKIDLINRMKTKAAAAGANAIIGLDFESTLPGGNTIMVSANGTAVIIEKI